MSYLEGKLIVRSIKAAEVEQREQNTVETAVGLESEARTGSGTVAVLALCTIVMELSLVATA